MKKFVCMLLVVALCFLFVGCGVPTKTLHCDRCGKEVKVAADSNMTEDWDLFCPECAEELGLNDLVEPRD